MLSLLQEQQYFGASGDAVLSSEEVVSYGQSASLHAFETASSPLHQAVHLVELCVLRTTELDTLPAYTHKTVARSTSFIPETPINTTAHSTSLGTNSIRRIAPEHVLRVMCLQSVASWLIEMWKHWLCAHHICIVQLLQIGIALNDLNVDLYHIARARTLAALLDLP